MILVLLQRDEPTLDLWFETQGQFSSKTCLTFISVLDQVSLSSSVMLSKRILSLRLWFSRNSIFNIFECLKLILDLRYGGRNSVTFIKIYRESNQLQLEALDVTEFCISRCKLSTCILFLWKIMPKEKHDKRLFNSAIGAINMDGPGKDNYGNTYSSWVNYFDNPE